MHERFYSVTEKEILTESFSVTIIIAASRVVLFHPEKGAVPRSCYQSNDVELP